MKFEHNPAHLIGTCQCCGEEMVFNVPRLGANGGYVHKSNGKFDCNNKTPMTPPNESALAAAREIEPCPFCGNKIVRLEYNTNAKWCICNHCHAQGPVAGEEDDAIKYWNDTKHSAAQQQEIIRLKEMITLGLASDIPSMDKLIQERDQLSARLAEMEKALKLGIEYRKQQADTNGIYLHPISIVNLLRLENKALTSTPSESGQKEKE